MWVSVHDVCHMEHVSIKRHDMYVLWAIQVMTEDWLAGSWGYGYVIHGNNLCCGVQTKYRHIHGSNQH